MDTVEVNILKYRFRFKPLTWREELSIKPEPKLDRRRQLLAHALTEVSGFPITSLTDSMKVFEAIPLTIISRIFIVYRGKLPAAHLFTTLGLYKAPEPMKYYRQVEAAQHDQEEDTFKQVEEMMERKFGREEMEAARELEAAIAKGSKLRGATRASSEQIVVEEKNVNPSR